MDETMNLITLIALIVAIVAIVKLRSVLGRRTDEDDTRVERFRAESQRQSSTTSSDGVVTLPRSHNEEVQSSTNANVSKDEAQTRVKEFAGTNKQVEHGLLEILERDSFFDPHHFLKGANQAYEMIVMAFAEGNRQLLRDLLSPDVFDGFSRAITDREAKGEQIDQSFVGIDKSDIIEADVKSGIANITVRFVSQLISATRDAAGVVVAGDAQKIKEVTDIWTFSRDLSSKNALANPNWTLVGTQTPH